MSQTVFILHNDDNDYIVKQIQAGTYINSAYYCENLFLDSEDLISLAEHTTSEYFYVIKTSEEICFTEFDFSFKPDHWDKHYLHTWNNDTTLRLYNKEEVLKDPDKFNDEALLAGRVQLKNIDQRITEAPVFDIIFLATMNHSLTNTSRI